MSRNYVYNKVVDNFCARCVSHNFSAQDSGKYSSCIGAKSAKKYEYERDMKQRFASSFV